MEAGRCVSFVQIEQEQWDKEEMRGRIRDHLPETTCVSKIRVDVNRCQKVKVT